MSEQCPREKGHFDGSSIWAGALLIAGIFLFAVVVPFWPRDGRAHIIWRTDKGLVCKTDVHYPEADCKTILDSFGPRLSRLQVER